MKWIFTVLLLVVAIDVFAVEWCQMPDSSVGVPGLPQVDTVRSIVIWAVGAGYLVERVPTCIERYGRLTLPSACHIIIKNTRTTLILSWWMFMEGRA